LREGGKDRNVRQIFKMLGKRKGREKGLSPLKFWKKKAGFAPCER